MKKSELKPCPCCGEEARYIQRGDFHLSFAISTPDPDLPGCESIEHNFLHDRAIQCSNCNLTMPEMDPDYPAELSNYWNLRSKPRGDKKENLRPDAKSGRKSPGAAAADRGL